MRMRSFVHGAVLVVSLSLTLVLLPIAINVGTGGTAPGFLEPYVDWVWPLIGVLWVLVIATALLELRNRRRPRLAHRSADQPRNRRNALDRVDRYLSERRAGSLAARTRIALALDGQPDAVRPFELFVQPLDSAPRRIPNEDIDRVFDELEDSMLVLGAPGAGKTTLLLDLARRLAAQAHADQHAPIPVVVDLAGWTAQSSHRSDDDPNDSPVLAGFVRWLSYELSDRYGIPPGVGRTWLRHGQLALLLDGLDEIAEAHRAKLEPVLKELRHNYQVGQLAVTCRTHDYERLPRQLSLFGAVHIRPLTRQQVLDYFATVGPALDGARAAIEQDDELWELVSSPLMLNVMTLAYQGRAPQDVTAGGVADLRRELFDTFICEVLARNRKTSRQYDARTAVRRLWCLAWWTRSRAGDRTAVPRWVAPDGWYGLSLREVDSLTHAVCLPAFGIRMVKSLPTDHLPATDVGDTWRMDLSVAGGAVAAFLVALVLGADLASPQLEAVAGIVVGAVAAKAWRRRPPVLAGPMSRWLHDLLLHWTGYLPWRRRAFLQYAADRYVLARTGHSQYAFIHLLVRDHLAECTPDELAAKVERRITERERS